MRERVGNDDVLGDLFLERIDGIRSYRMLPSLECRNCGRTANYALKSEKDEMISILTCSDERCWKSAKVLGQAKQIHLSLMQSANQG